MVISYDSSPKAPKTKRKTAERSCAEGAEGARRLTETNLVQSIRLALSKGACRVFRNNCGALQDKTGRWVHYGLADGSADLIGWRTVQITPEMVGREIAQFVSVEVKKPKARTDKKRAEDQANWRNAVADAGGVAAEVRSVQEAEAALK